jgi:lipoyl(octanoyl) transferase
MTREALLVDLGVMNYGQALGFQKQVWQLRVDEKVPDTLLLVEHPHVITLGKSGRIENLLAPEAKLRQEGVELYRVERGGDITYHGPGQLVGYPIFLLQDALAGVRKFVAAMEASLIQALSVWRIRGESRPRLTGVWVGDKKIAALGIAVSRRVTFHGFALNVNTDLNYFRLINPCGIGRGVTSMCRELGRRIPVAGVKHQVAVSFEEVFGIEFALSLHRACRAVSVL